VPDPDRAAVMTVTFSALGPVRAWRDGFELPLGTPQQRTTLALLLEREGRVVTTGELVDALWPLVRSHFGGRDHPDVRLSPAPPPRR